MLPEEKEKLLEYLKTAIAIETDITMQDQILKTCSEEIKQKTPKYTPLEEPERPRFCEYPTKSLFFFYLFSSIFFLVIAIITIFFSEVFFLLILGSIGFLAAAYTEYNHYLQKKESYQLQSANYNKKLQECREINQRRKQEQKERYNHWAQFQQEFRESIESVLHKTTTLRNEFYAQGNLIYSKYHNLPALTSIYEYFITGRCDDLTGPHGAYNMYEDEVRKDTVISQLNAVIENLDQIKQNQYMLYQQVKSIQQTTGAVLQELSQIKGYTIALTELNALNAYYTALNERNSRIMMYYHLAP